MKHDCDGGLPVMVTIDLVVSPPCRARTRLWPINLLPYKPDATFLVKSLMLQARCFVKHV